MLTLPPALAEAVRNADCGFIVTGAGGWIGQAALEMLDQALGAALPARTAAFGSNDRLLTFRSGRALPCRDLKHIAELPARPWFFIHCAFLTKDRLQTQDAQSFIDSNRAIGDRVAEAVTRHETRGFFMPSSGAVYKKGTHVPDSNLTANPYGVLKLEDERRFGALTAKKKIPACIPRVFNLAGPFINKLDIYALASIIGSVQKGQPITLRAPHRVVRSYIHVGDLLALGFAMLLKPQKTDVPVFDTAGAEALEVSELAARIGKVLGRPDLPILRPEIDRTKEADIYVGDGARMISLMKAHDLVAHSMDEQIRDTAEYMASLSKVAA